MLLCLFGKGDEGMRGLPGISKPGAIGPPGLPGPRGEPGRVIEIPTKPTLPALPGLPGQKGEPGIGNVPGLLDILIQTYVGGCIGTPFDPAYNPQCSCDGSIFAIWIRTPKCRVIW